MGEYNNPNLVNYRSVHSKFRTMPIELETNQSTTLRNRPITQTRQSSIEFGYTHNKHLPPSFNIEEGKRNVDLVPSFQKNWRQERDYDYSAKLLPGTTPLVTTNKVENFETNNITTSSYDYL